MRTLRPLALALVLAIAHAASALGDPESSAAATCSPQPTRLCLNNQRFEVEVRWKDFQGNTGSGTAVPLTGDTGYFWFFNSTNVELVVKVLDGRTLNGHFWVFYGALSNVEYTMTVTDTTSGAARTYANPSGRFASVGDTQAFPAGAGSAQSVSHGLSTPPAVPGGVAIAPLRPTEGTTFRRLRVRAPAACSSSPTSLCLNANRFRVAVEWRDFEGRTGSGQAVRLTSDTGYFWFFNSANVELIVKVLDARALNGHFWVFYGALSNVQYQLTVTDTETGGVQTYVNPAEQFASVGDTTPTFPTNFAKLLLNEILFAPRPGKAQFIELKNAGPVAGEVAGLSLVNEAGQTYTLPTGLPPLSAGAVLLLLFDGQNRIEGGTVHADRSTFLAPIEGFVELRSPGNSSLDSVGWTPTHPHAVRLSHGGLVAPTRPGITIGRFPQSGTARNRFEWLMFDPDEVTPGIVNPVPSVKILLPFSGSVFPQAAVDLTWYPAPGATRYRVQVASEASFATPVLERVVETPFLNTGALASGQYFWRVGAVSPDGSSGGFSPVNSLRTGVALSQSASWLSAAAPSAILPVPLIKQRKDTRMLLMEHPVETGVHAWDRDHGDIDPADPADIMNCGLAATAMAVKFFGGSLSQDRIGYELFKGRVQGPEKDLMYGEGLNGIQLGEVIAFALGSAPSLGALPADLDTFWSDVKSEIDAGRPLIAGALGHAFLIRGYSEAPGARYIHTNDGIYGQKTIDITAFRLPNPTEQPTSLDVYYRLPAAASPRSDEPEVDQDSDGDGLVDFDETRRFGTNPQGADTDGDAVPDKDDVRSGVFDPTYGYALDPEPGGAGRDFDGDRLPTERDEDSDAGGCKDGLEDRNGNGKRDGNETSNFDTSDDNCAYWEGQVRFSRQEGVAGQAMATFTMTSSVRFLPESTGTQATLYTVEGTMSYRSEAVAGLCTNTVGPVTVGLRGPTDGSLVVDASVTPNRYSGAGQKDFQTTGTIVCPDFTETFTGPAGGIWFYAPPGLFTVRDNGQKIKDTYTDHNGTWEWELTRREQQSAAASTPHR